MSKINDGGPAFPLKNYTSTIGPDNCGFMAKDTLGKTIWVNSGSPGMSLRAYFVGQLFSNVTLCLEAAETYEEVAVRACEQADAAIKQLNKTEID